MFRNYSNGYGNIGGNCHNTGECNSNYDDCECSCNRGPMGPAGPAGCAGPVGPRGADGAVGSRGSAGTPGCAGPRGIPGSTGAQGTPGCAGPRGIPGAQGAQGIPGLVGRQGPQGAQGIPGPTGPQGVQGFQGNTGAQGFQGIPGPTGAQGAQGFAGPTGATGITGITGATGASGRDGARGSVGPTGAAGSRGEPGMNGAMGPTGPAGMPGTNGAMGPTGPAGFGGTGAVIAFASGYAPRANTNQFGQSVNAIPIAFGPGMYDLDLLIEADGSIDLARNCSGQQAFSIPMNGRIAGIYASCINYEEIQVPDCVTAFPVIQIYRADRDSNLFIPIEGTEVLMVNGFSGCTPAGTTVYGSMGSSCEALSAGDRILIIGRMVTMGRQCLSQGYRIYFTGGLLLR